VQEAYDDFVKTMNFGFLGMAICFGFALAGTLVFRIFVPDYPIHNVFPVTAFNVGAFVIGRLVLWGKS
jgi:hypothetical protein